MTISKLRKRNKISSLLLNVLHKREIRHFHVLSCKNGKEMYKKWEVVVLLIKPFFLTFSLPSASLDLKVSNVLYIKGPRFPPVTSCENCSIDLFSLSVLSHFRVRDAHALKGICLLSFLQYPSHSPRYGFRAARAPVSECSTYPG